LDEDEEAYRRRIVRELNRKTRGEGPREKAAHVKTEAELKKEAEEAEYAEILRREKMKDAQWRAEVAARAHAKKDQHDQAEYEMKWAALKHSASASASASAIRVEDLPWPPGVSMQSSPKIETLRLFLFQGNAGGAPEAIASRKKAIRKEQMRWHPDKFNQSVAPRLPPAIRQAALVRAMEIAKALNEIASDLK